MPYRGQARGAPPLTDGNGGHHTASGAFTTIAEEKIEAASGTESRSRNICRRDSRFDQNRAIRRDKIELDSGRRRRMPGRPHGKPRKPIGIVFAGRERVERTIEPFARVGKLRVKLLGDIAAHFVTGLGDARADCGDNITRARAEFHLHAAERLLRDALYGTAPAGMNCRNGTPPCVGEKDWDTVGSLHDKEDSRLAREERVGLRRLI